MGELGIHPCHFGGRHWALNSFLICVHGTPILDWAYYQEPWPSVVDFAWVCAWKGSGKVCSGPVAGCGTQVGVTLYPWTSGGQAPPPPETGPWGARGAPKLQHERSNLSSLRMLPPDCSPQRSLPFEPWPHREFATYNLIQAPICSCIALWTLFLDTSDKQWHLQGQRPGVHFPVYSSS